MASFFENLSYIMGGEENITPEFRSAFGEYNALTTPTASASAAGQGFGNLAPPPTQQKVGLFGMDISRLTGQPAYGGGGSFTEADQNTISVGEPSASGLYGGNVQYNAGKSAYSDIDPNAYLWNKKRGASNLSAAVQRAQYQDYLNRFAPVENYALGQINGRETRDLGFDLARANQSVMNAGLNLHGQQERAMGRFGLDYKGPTIAQSNDITGGRVAAMNQARMADEDRALSMVSGTGKSEGGGK